MAWFQNPPPDTKPHNVSSKLMKNETQEYSSNEIAGIIAEKYLQGKSYDYVVATARQLMRIAEVTCKIPILQEQT